MPLQDFFQLSFIESRLLKHLFNTRLVLGPPHAGGNGDDVRGNGFQFLRGSGNPAVSRKRATSIAPPTPGISAAMPVSAASR